MKLQLLKLIPQRERVPFFSGASKIILGSLTGQLIVFAFYPVISRFYSPSSFGVYSVYISLLNIIAPISTLSYELAIPLAKKDKSALNLLSLCLLASLTFALLLIVILGASLFFLPDSVTLHPFVNYLWLLPLGVLGVGTYDSLSYWIVRKRNFGLIGRTKIFQGVVMVLLQVVWGWLFHSPFGLILGYIARHAIGSRRFFIALKKEIYLPFRFISLKTISSMARRYIRFPALSTPSLVIHSLSLYLPIVLISSFYGVTAAGFFGFGMQLIQGGLSILRAGVSQVYVGEAAKLLKTKPKKLRNFYLKTIFFLLSISLIPLLILLLFGSAIFSFLFGAHWMYAGEFMQILAIPLWLGFGIDSVSKNLNLLEKQSYFLLWNLTFLFLTCLSFITAYYFNFAVTLAVLLYAIIRGGIYIALLILNILIINQKVHEKS